MPVRRIQTIQERAGSGSSTLLLRRVTTVVDDCVRLATTDNILPATLGYCLTRLESLERNIRRARGTLLQEADAASIQESLQQIIVEFRKGYSQGNTSTGYQAQRVEATRGAPRFAITRRQLQLLVQCGFTMPRMGRLLGVSVKTVKRRLKQFGLRLRGNFASLTDPELDEAVKGCINHNQRLGPNAIRARLFARGSRVQRWRVRESMLRVDPGGAALRSTVAVRRRTYTVAGPNSLWHVDGNHKLVRWGIVIHGGIDGFSRMLVFLRASDNNRKETVLGQFLAATSTYGLPSRVRVDCGGENNDVCDVMELLRGRDRGSAIRGRSVHNQRIERSWVDTWNGATNLFYDLFHFLEHHGSIEIDNAVHMWALHYVFLPRLNRELDAFTEQWNNHGLRTEHHESPLQLFVGNSLELANSQLTAIRDMFPSMPTQDNEGADGNAEDRLDWDADATVDIPQVQCPLSAEALLLLKDAVDPLGDSNDLGMDLYLRVLNFVAEQQ